MLALGAGVGQAQPAAQPAPPVAVSVQPGSPRIDLVAPPVGETRVVVVQQDPGAAGGLHTATVQRGGKTYVITTDHALTPAELDARVARLAAAVAAMPAPGAATPLIVAETDGPGGKRQVVVRSGPPGGATDAIAMSCAAQGAANTMVEAAEGSKRLRMQFCGKPAQVKASLLAARGQVAGDGRLSATLKAKMLGQIDAALARAQ